MMRPGAVLAFLLLASCRLAGGATYVVAVGADDDLPTWQGRCDTSTARPQGLVEFKEDRFYRAKKPGSVTLSCEKGKLVLDVRPVDRLVIEGPDEVGGRDTSYKVVALDKKGQRLTIGKYAPVFWEAPAGLERGAGCHGDIMPSCDGADQLRVRATGATAGSGELAVRFGDRHATKVVRVNPGSR